MKSSTRELQDPPTRHLNITKSDHREKQLRLVELLITPGKKPASPRAIGVSYFGQDEKPLADDNPSNLQVTARRIKKPPRRVSHIPQPDTKDAANYLTGTK